MSVVLSFFYFQIGQTDFSKFINEDVNKTCIFLSILFFFYKPNQAIFKSDAKSL